jgi:hypothetical protein
MVSPQDARRASASRIVTGGTEQTAPAADPQLLPSLVVGRLEDMLRRFEPGAPPPAGARELLRELHDALAEGHPGEGVSRPISGRPLGASPPLGLNRLRMIDPRRRAARRRKRFATCATSSNMSHGLGARGAARG